MLQEVCRSETTQLDAAGRLVEGADLQPGLQRQLAASRGDGRQLNRQRVRRTIQHCRKTLRLLHDDKKGSAELINSWRDTFNTMGSLFLLPRGKTCQRTK